MFVKLQQLLEAGKISKEAAEALDAEISLELKKLRDESASWRVKYQDLNKNYESISKTKEELEAKLSNFDKEIQKAKDEGKSELVKELEKERTQIQELQANLENISKENRALKVQSGIDRALQNYEVIDKELVSSYIRNLVEFKDDNLKFKKGDSLLDLEEGLKSFFEDKAHLLKSKGQGGSGTEKNGGNFAKDSLTAQKLAMLNK